MDAWKDGQTDEWMKQQMVTMHTIAILACDESMHSVHMQSSMCVLG